jgi:hypothetical protein
VPTVGDRASRPSPHPPCGDGLAQARCCRGRSTGSPVRWQVFRRPAGRWSTRPSLIRATCRAHSVGRAGLRSGPDALFQHPVVPAAARPVGRSRRTPQIGAATWLATLRCAEDRSPRRHTRVEDRLSNLSQHASLPGSEPGQYPRWPSTATADPPTVDSQRRSCCAIRQRCSGWSPLTHVPSAVPRPRHRRHHDAVPWAAHPRRVDFHEHPYPAQIQRPPAAASLPLVISGNPPPAHPTPAPLPRVGRTDTTTTPSSSPTTTRPRPPSRLPPAGAHNLAFRTPFSRRRSSDLRQART